MGRHYCTKTVWEIPTIAAGIRRTAALPGVTLLIVGLLSAVLPPACRLPSSALADPGNDNGGDGHGNSNDHDHENNGNGPNGNSRKGKDEDDDDAAAVRPAAAAAEAERNGRDYVPDELVVANMGDVAKSDIGRLGFVVLDEQQLASLGLTITRVRVPRRMRAPAARTLLATQYPGVLVDLNGTYRPQGTRSPPL
jgi:hypothetical protein